MINISRKKSNFEGSTNTKILEKLGNRLNVSENNAKDKLEHESKEI